MRYSKACGMKWVSQGLGSDGLEVSVEIDEGSPERPYVIMGAMPSSGDWAEIEAEGYGIRLFDYPGTIESLLPYSRHFRHLNVTAGPTTDLHVLPRMTQLELLFIAGVINEVLDLSPLTNLHTFGAGQAHRVTGVFDNPALRKLFVTWGSHKWAPIEAPLTQCTIRSAQKLANVTSLKLAHPEELLELQIYDGKSLSLEGIGELSAIRRLSFTSCKLSNASALQELPMLEYIYLEDCTLDELRSVSELRDLKVKVVGRHPFGRDLVAAAVNGGLLADWEFPPRDVARITGVKPPRV